MNEAVSPPINAALVKQLVPKLFAITAQLEAAAPGRKFTPDGHTMGQQSPVLALQAQLAPGLNQGGC